VEQTEAADQASHRRVIEHDANTEWQFQENAAPSLRPGKHKQHEPHLDQVANVKHREQELPRPHDSIIYTSKTPDRCPCYLGAVKILWASPLPPTRSGVSDYAVELLPDLAITAELRVASPPGWAPPEDWPLGAECEVVSGDTRPQEDEIQLLHIGNNPHHEWLIERIAWPRTVVVLHDLVLHHLLVEATLAHGMDDRFAELLIKAHAHDGETLIAGRRVGITGGRDPFMFPARRAFFSGAPKIVVHSKWAEAQVLADFPGAKVGRIGLAVADPGEVDRQAARARLGFSSDEVIVMHLGFLTPAKGMLEIFSAVHAARGLGVAVRLVVVGEGRELDTLENAALRAGLHDALTATGWIPSDQFLEVPAAADLGVVLRTPSAGETSAAALRFLACGTPVAVSGLNQFLEWPELAAPRLTPGPSAAAELTRLVIDLTTSAEWRSRREAARSAYTARHRPAAVAAELLDYLADCAG
jgi:glycosyltransferase involved in cell wall biosynthesis